MRAVMVIMGFVGVLLGARMGWQIGLLMSLGAVPGVSVGPVVGIGSTLLLAGGGALIGGLIGGAACLLLGRMLWWFAGPQH